MIKRNVIANMLGNAWSWALQFVIVPFQIEFLGVEAFGLLAFLALVQILFSIFDLGLSPTITREVAADQSSDLRHSRDLVQTLSLPYGGIGVLLSVALAASAPWLATHWLQLDRLSTGSATLALQLGALVILLRWPVTFCTGIIAGRHRFDLLNLLTAGTITVGLLGGIAVIILSSSLIALLVWRIAVALVEVTLYIVVCFRLLPGLSLRPRFAAGIARQVWSFAGSMGVLTIVSLLLSQSDRFVISRLLPIAALGYYAIASNIAWSLVSIQAAVASVMFPALTASYVRGEREVMAVQTAKAAQVITFCLAFPTFVAVFFGYDVLRLWIDRETADASYQLLAILVLGFLLSSPLNVLSSVAMATGHLRRLVPIGVFALCAYIPGLYILTTRFSLQGAALATFSLQIYYFVLLPPLVLPILDQPSALAWLRRNLLPFVLIGAATTGFAKAVVSMSDGGIAIIAVACGLSALAYVAAAFLALHEDLRRSGQQYFEHLFLSFRRLLGIASETSGRDSRP